MKNVKTTSKEKVYLHNNGNFVLVFQKSPKNYDFSNTFQKRPIFSAHFLDQKVGSAFLIAFREIKPKSFSTRSKFWTSLLKWIYINFIKRKKSINNGRKSNRESRKVCHYLSFSSSSLLFLLEYNNPLLK